LTVGRQEGGATKAVVAHESLWGNTAAIARAIAEGIRPEARALSTAEATGAAIADADLLVAGAPVLAFGLSSEKMREGIRANPGKAPAPPDFSHPSMRSWLEALPTGHGRSAAFDTRARGPFGKAAPEIAQALEGAGYRPLAQPLGFVVTGRYGPLRAGELERARLWGAELAKAME
jgi:hypothetical protein